MKGPLRNQRGHTQKAQRTALEKKRRGERSCRNNCGCNSDKQNTCRSKYHLLLFHPFSPTANYKLIRGKIINLGVKDLEVEGEGALPIFSLLGFQGQEVSSTTSDFYLHSDLKF